MDSPTKMQKYLYKAQAIALRGSIRKPYFQELGDHLAIATYAGFLSLLALVLLPRAKGLFIGILWATRAPGVEAG